MMKLPIRPKPTGHHNVDSPPQTLPYRHPDPPTQPAACDTATRHHSNCTIDNKTATASNASAQPPPHADPAPSAGLNDRSDDEAFHLEADEKKNYRRNMLLLAAAVRERIAGRGRHAHGRLYDAKLAESMHDLEKLVGCFSIRHDPQVFPGYDGRMELHPPLETLTAMQENLSPDPRRGRSDRPNQYLADIKTFWSTQDIPSAAAPYVPCWELVAGRTLTAQERAAIGLDAYLDGEIDGQRTAGGRGGGGSAGWRKTRAWWL
ncbi:hypothetical protein MMC11_001099 [Xylographa trunciseda]|nr:hypothetical protein [Xylographa trunciseda]